MDIEILESNKDLRERLRYFREVAMIYNVRDCRRLTFGLIPVTKYLNKIINQYITDILCDHDVINWWGRVCNFLKVINTKDHSLYASASIAMWGFEDKKSLYRDSKIEEKNFGPSGIKSLWKFEMQRYMKYAPVHDRSIGECTYKFHGDFPKDSPADKLIYLQIEIYILSNALMRPIIIFGFKLDECIQVYLPLNHDPSDCCKDPLILTYFNMNNLDEFYPLLQIEDITGNNAVPLVNGKGLIAQVKFLIDEDANFKALNKYMDIVLLKEPPNAIRKDRREYYCARITQNIEDRPFYYITIKRLLQQWSNYRLEAEDLNLPYVEIPKILWAPTVNFQKK